MTDQPTRRIVALYLRDVHGDEICSTPVFKDQVQLEMVAQKAASICNLEVVLNDGFKTTIQIAAWTVEKDDAITMPLPNLVPTAVH